MAVGNAEFVRSMVGGVATVAVVHAGFSFLETDEGLVEALHVADDWMAFSVGQVRLVLTPELLERTRVAGSGAEGRHLAVVLDEWTQLLVYPQRAAAT